MIKTLRDIDVEGKRVLLRVDYNVPINIEDDTISDDSRIVASLPTIEYLIENKAKIILCTHMGRPDGRIVDTLRTRKLADRLAEHLQQDVKYVQDCIGEDVVDAVSKMKNNDVLMLENIRFYADEINNDERFAEKLASLADVYVNDAFGTAHRSHASVVGVAQFLPAVAGFLMEAEIGAMSALLENPKHPFACLIGGAKISDKIALLENMIGKADFILINGGMAATFFQSQGYEVGKSMVEKERLSMALNIMQISKDRNTELLLPVDVVIARDINRDDPEAKTVAISDIKKDRYIVDIGRKTIGLFSSKLKGCKTIFWNGPMGIYEIPRFATGTFEIAETIAGSGAKTVVGGGSSAEVIRKMGLLEKISHVSTGGGASLKFLEGKTLPGIEVLEDTSN
jgi:phosphoglycerate kinase